MKLLLQGNLFPIGLVDVKSTYIDDNLNVMMSNSLCEIKPEVDSFAFAETGKNVDLLRCTGLYRNSSVQRPIADCHQLRLNSGN
jgi:hypothetical protein